jgi:hypothetical protein
MTNRLPRNIRLANAGQDIAQATEMLNTSYNLQPLADFIGVKGKISLEDNFGKPEDFAGRDLQILVNDTRIDQFVSDKKRDEKKNEESYSDLGTEIARFFKSGKRSPFGDFDPLSLIFSGGRDLICVPRDDIHAHFCDQRGIIIADHSVKTMSDLTLLRTNVRDPAFIKSDIVKKIAEYYMEECQKRFLEILPELVNSVCLNQKYTFTELFNCPPGVELKCLKETDKKFVTYNGVKRACSYGKIILYIDLEKFWTEGKEYIVVRERQS